MTGVQDRPVLVVQHEDACPPGLVGAWLVEEGIPLDVCRPYAGTPLPASLARRTGLVVLGGHMGAGDDGEYAWLAPTKALIREAAEEGTPVLGICLGHQLAAVALGGEVVRNPAGKRRGALEMGWLPAAREDPLLAGCGRRGVQWHRDVVTRLPSGTQVLGRAHTGELLAARFAPTVWGVQSHPEADTGIVDAWAAWDSTEASRAEVPAIEEALDAVHAASTELRAGWRPLVTAFAAQVRAASSVLASH